MYGFRERMALAVAICAVSVTGCDAGSESLAPYATQAELDAGSVDDQADASPAPDIVYARLVDLQGFRPCSAQEDPLPSHQPAAINCADSALVAEYGGFEIDTGLCNYVLAEAPALRAVARGAWVHLDFVHYDLAAPAPAEAHVALFFADVLQWEEFIPVPSPGARIEATFRAKSALAAGEMVRVHLHNHGGNTYLLTRLEVEDGSASAP
jgi:hypothetical protein